MPSMVDNLLNFPGIAAIIRSPGDSSAQFVTTPAMSSTGIRFIMDIVSSGGLGIDDGRQQNLTTPLAAFAYAVGAFQLPRNIGQGLFKTSAYFTSESRCLYDVVMFRHLPFCLHTIFEFVDNFD